MNRNKAHTFKIPMQFKPHRDLTFTEKNQACILLTEKVLNGLIIRK